MCRMWGKSVVHVVMLKPYAWEIFSSHSLHLIKEGRCSWKINYANSDYQLWSANQETVKLNLSEENSNFEVEVLCWKCFCSPSPCRCLYLLWHTCLSAQFSAPEDCSALQLACLTRRCSWIHQQFIVSACLTSGPDLSAAGGLWPPEEDHSDLVPQQEAAGAAAGRQQGDYQGSSEPPWTG